MDKPKTLCFLAYLINMGERKWKLTKANCESILNGISDLVRVISVDGEIVFCNERMKEEFGDIVGLKCYEVLCKDERCSDCISIKTLNEGKKFTKNETFNGRIYNITSSPFYDDDKNIIGTVEVFKDITEHKKIEDRLKKQNEILRRDLEYAKRLQQQLLPIIPRIDGYRITYTYKPCERMSGDFIDVLDIGDNIFFYVADVAGHGILSSMVTVFMKQTILKNVHTAKDLKVQEILKMVIQDFIGMNFPPEIYITTVFGVLNKKTQEVSIISAGHVTEPILVKASRKVRVINLKGQPIASIFLGTEFEEKKFVLEKNDKLILYSDGLIETRNKQGEMYGKKRLIKRLLSVKNINAELLVRDIRNFAHTFEDDIAVLIVEKL